MNRRSFFKGLSGIFAGLFLGSKAIGGESKAVAELTATRIESWKELFNPPCDGPEGEFFVEKVYLWHGHALHKKPVNEYLSALWLAKCMVDKNLKIRCSVPKNAFLYEDNHRHIFKFDGEHWHCLSNSKSGEIVGYSGFPDAKTMGVKERIEWG